ncbi:GNAT family N-acetyltransferase [Heyndrickxia sp. NPDC080065]|uniref:GNAT family N-acetyltransferase n=1 Tax=Heyndrickxia sp. NPDC080065 TaxID=3390568 RepID=UPI003D0531D9
MIQLTQIEKKNREKYKKLLLIADEDEVAINKYLYDGMMFSIHYDNQCIGVVLITLEPILEIKNIAVIESYRGKGIGKKVIEELKKIAKINGYQSMIVGTANSSIDNIAFYQKCGFRMDSIKKNFFESYSSPIYENGIRALDMIIFRCDI